MPGHNVVHGPPCPNGCRSGAPLSPDQDEFQYRSDFILACCSGCAENVRWSPDEKYVIRCQHCNRMFVNRWIPPAYKTYVTYDDDRKTRILYCCEACSLKGLEVVEPSDEEEPASEDVDASEDEDVDDEPEPSPEPEPVPVSVSDEATTEVTPTPTASRPAQPEPGGPIEGDLAPPAPSGLSDDAGAGEDDGLTDHERAVIERARQQRGRGRRG